MRQPARERRRFLALAAATRGRLRVGEVPIAFDDRRRGKSKLGWRQRLDYLRHLGRRQRLDYLRHLGRLYRHVYGGRLTRRSGPRR